MFKIIRHSLLFFCFFIMSALQAELPPMQVLPGPNWSPSPVASVDFHPNSRLFCATFTKNNSLVFYRFDNSGTACVYQILQGTRSQLNCPQSALFSGDGQYVLVANGSGQTFNLYRADANGFYQQVPAAVLPFPSPTDAFHPEGMAISPNGKYLAVALGGAKKHPQAVVAVYRIDQPGTEQMQLRLMGLLQENEIAAGAPKGVAFSPDGSCLLVTLSETHSAILYTLDLRNKTIVPAPRQILRGQTSGLSSPGDVRFTAVGDSFAISNKDTLTFYRYDQAANRILDKSPSHIMENPVAKPGISRGLAFSPDGKFLTVSRVDPALPSWGKESKDTVTVYQLK